MRLRSRKHQLPLLLFLLPALASSAAVDSSKSKPGSVSHLASEKNPKLNNADLPSAPDARPEVGTKDAPVDGLDGKPHAGPFVESTKKKNSQQVEDLSTVETMSKEQQEKALKDTFDRPQDDGVMSDVADRKALTGPTGTEGGVSQKEREKIEKMEKGDVSEKKPAAPKEAPKLVDIAGEGATTSKGKDSEGEGTEKKKGAAGLEVC
jgi:hypothetical protein